MTTPKTNENLRKELFEYLRNKQKEAEIQSKVNGINVWVILGAISLVVWQIVENSNSLKGFNWKIALTLILLAQTLVMAVYIALPQQGLRNEVRYARFQDNAYGLDFIRILQTCIQWLPITIYIKYFGFIDSVKSLFVLLMVFALITFAKLLSVILDYFRNEDETDLFPKPQFSGWLSENKKVSSMISAYLLVDFFDHIFNLAPTLKEVAVPEAKMLVLIVALYILVLLLAEQRDVFDRTRWTYEMETDLLVGATTPDEALEQIESRQLGLSFHKKMQAFMENLDTKINDLEKSREDLESLLSQDKRKFISIENLIEVVKSGSFDNGKFNKTYISINDSIKSFHEHMEIAEIKFEHRVAIFGVIRRQMQSYEDKLKTQKTLLEENLKSIFLKEKEFRP